MTKLRQIRIDKGLKTQELANISGVTYRNILHYELGDRNINGAKLDTIVNLALALDVDIRDILEDDELIAKLTLLFKRL